MTTIYLSSTYEDLKDHRKAVFDALRQSGHQVIAMEDYVARDDRPLKACLDDVDQADIYVGLFAFRYGYVPPVEHENPEGRSITELEYRRAEASENTRCLVFLPDENAAWPLSYVDAKTGDGERGALIEQLRDELSRDKMGSFFSAPYELASKVQSAVSQVLLSAPTGSAGKEEAVPEVSWDVATLGSPYPGLLHFTRRFAPVFFGREAEVRELLDRLTLPEGRFLIVSGDSGSGKSSLVDAGVLSRLEEHGKPSRKASLRILRMVPSAGEDPFDALLRALRPLAERVGLDDYRLGRDLADGQAVLADVLRELISGGLDADRLLLFLDQMEELFTARNNDGVLVERFLSGLYAATQILPVQVIATIRSDLLHHCYAQEDLLCVLRGRGHYPLGRAAPHNLYEMIVRPAQSAGVSVPESLANRFVEDVGTEPGNLPLLAFALQRLFEKREDDVLSEVAYKRMGGLTGAIGEHVGEVERRLAKELDLTPNPLERLLADLFEPLVQVDIEGLPTRRRARLAQMPDSLAPLVESLIQARLLTSEGEGEDSTVSVAHEHLFEAWPALSRWVAEHQDDLRLLRQGELDASEWRRQGHNLTYLWHLDRLQRLQAVIETQPPGCVGQELRTFAWPQQRLIRLLDNPDLDHESRDTVGRYLTVLGDPRPGVGVREDGIPDIDWVAIPSGKVELEEGAGKAKVATFHMSRYLITNAQFRAFVDAAEGYGRSDWWKDMPDDANDGPKGPRWPVPNQPRETVSWYEAVAFCRWLSARLGVEVRLPTEHEWQQAATGGDPGNVFPWGPEWDARCCNASESGLNRTVAVGLYPAGASAQGVLDLSGNLWEWCLSKHDKPEDTAVDNSDRTRVVRGGSWILNQDRARAGRRDYLLPVIRHDYYGFRVVCSSPIG